MHRHLPKGHSNHRTLNNSKQVLSQRSLQSRYGLLQVTTGPVNSKSTPCTGYVQRAALRQAAAALKQYTSGFWTAVHTEAFLHRADTDTHHALLLLLDHYQSQLAHDRLFL